MPNYSYSGLAMWVHAELMKRYGGRMKHLLLDARDLVQRLRGIKLPVGSRLAKLDAKKFYLKGMQDQIVTPLEANIAKQHKGGRALLAAIRFLFSHQYVSSEW